MPTGSCRFRVSNIDSTVTLNEFQEALGQLALDDVVVEPESFREDAGGGSNAAIIRLAPHEADILRGPMKEAKVFVDRSSGDSKGIKMELRFQEIKQPKEAAEKTAEGERPPAPKMAPGEAVQAADAAAARENSEEAERLDKALTPRPQEEKPPRRGEDSAPPEVGHFDLPKASIMMEPQPRMAPQREEPQREARPPGPPRGPAMEEPAPAGRQRPQGYPPVDSSSLGRQRPRFDPPEESAQQRRPPFPPPEQSSPDRRGLGGSRDPPGQDWGTYPDPQRRDGLRREQAGPSDGVYRDQRWQDPGLRRDQAGQDGRSSTPSSEQGEYFSHCSRMLETVDGQPKILRTCVAQTANCVVS